MGGVHLVLAARATQELRVAMRNACQAWDWIKTEHRVTLFDTLEDSVYSGRHNT